MKTITIDGQQVTILMARGWGDGGAAVRYFVDEGDGTFSEYPGDWYSDPKRATEVLEKVDDGYVRWVISEARRNTMPPSPEKPAQQARPDPLTGEVAITAIE